MLLKARAFALPLAVVAAAASLAGYAPTPAVAGDKPAYCKDTGDLDAKKMPRRVSKSKDCDLTGRVLRYDQAIAAAVPPTGLSQFAEAYTADGTERTLTVTAESDGDTYTIVTPENASTVASAAGPAACSDTFYRGAGYKIVTQLNWYYSNVNGVSNLSAAQVAAGIKKGADNMVLANNDCNDNRVPTSSHVYRGGTPGDPSMINQNGTLCSGASDGVNIAGWRSMAADILAVTCALRSAGNSGPDVVESDWALNRNLTWDETTLDGCTNAWVISGVMTHEWGHTVGLAHVEESTHGNETMSVNNNGQCQNEEQTLAQGEVDAMIIKYGAR